MRRDFGDGRPNEWKKRKGDMPVNENPTPAQLASGWGNYVLKNDMFESYYKKLKIMPESDWEEFLAAMRKPLPTTFRINGSGKFACEIRDQMQRDFVDLLKDGIEVDGEKLDPPRPLPWYPSNLAWHMSFSRTQLRKLPILLKVFDFMKRENEIGSITRQEAVSMVPPLLLDVQPHHFVLDMCAAPGSKTFQLLEMIHNGQEPSNLPTGMVVANDVDVQRCHLLIHQTQRMCSPSILVTNHEAQFFPSLKGHPKGGHGGAPGGAASSSPSSSSSLGPDGLMFDRILCDVPCSGDGTLRKAPDIWRKWTVGAGNGLHNLQVRIAMRGVALLKVGGRLIYSTCSLNPVEDEAVVAQVLRESQGAVELVDASHLLPALKRRPGLKSWKIKDKKRWYSSWSQVDEKRAGTLVSSMFPSGRGAAGGGAAGPQAAAGSAAAPAAGASSEAPRDAAAEDDGGSIEVAEGGGLGAAAAAVADEDEGEEGPAEVSNLPLERCMRVLPQDQDTGGFFIAVLQKVAPLVAAAPLPNRERADRNHESRNREREERERAVRGAQAETPSAASGGSRKGQDRPEGGEENRAAVADGPGGAGPALIGAGVAAEGAAAGRGGHAPEMEPEALAGEVVEEEEETLGEGMVVEGEGVEPNGVLGEVDAEGEEDEKVAAAAAMEVDAGGVIEENGKGDASAAAGRGVQDGEVAEAAAAATAAAAGGGGDDGKSAGERKAEQNRRFQLQGKWRGVDPVLFVDEESVVASIENYYGIGAGLPLRGHLVRRSEDALTMKRVYYAAKPVRDVVEANHRSGEQLKMISIGLKVFERQSMKEGMAPCAFRIAAEGLPILLPHITRQIVECGPRDFKLVLARRSLHFEAFHDLALVKALQDSLMGCLVLALRRPDEDLSKPPKTAVGLWRGKANVSLLVTKVESNQMLERLDLGPDEVEAEGGAEVAPPAEETAAAAAADGDATARDAPGATAVAPAATADALVPSKASGSGDEVNNGHLLEPSVPQQEV